jgi:hypothetical protein
LLDKSRRWISPKASCSEKNSFSRVVTRLGHPASGQSRPESGGWIAETGKTGTGTSCNLARGSIERCFPYPDVILIRDEQEPQRPDHRLEGSLAFEQIDAIEKSFEKNLLARRKIRVALRAAPRRSGRQPSRFKLEEIVQRQVEKNV